MGQNKKISRRSFLGRTAGLAAGGLAFPMIVPSSALGLDGRPSPSNRVVMGSIGVGPQGSGVMGNFLGRRDAQVVAVCDVKKWVRDAAKKKVDDHYGDTGCAAYTDLRELVARPDIDAVTVATPDHWHVLAALYAVRAGKSVYVEKPLGVSVTEDQTLRKAVHEHGVKFQFGTQQRSGDQFRQACELAINGYIGELKEINVWAPGSSSGGSLEPCPVPEGLDYETWIGPAPMVQHTPNRCDNSLWWFNSDYAIGFIAGWGIHPVDIALWGAGSAMNAPVSLEGQGTYSTEGICNTAVTWLVTAQY
ncbi:MAG: Gfo/Idh/MocA family oxidoreductase, partial [Candidatus Hydrogenedentes bacterium]|nr:Gfo/Idh/MocA family oxidoreductase [Candidatus Hydrogenedentota bacterium]